MYVKMIQLAYIELDRKEGRALKNWCFWTVVLEKTLESPLDCKEISPGISLEGMMLKLKLQFLRNSIIHLICNPTNTNKNKRRGREKEEASQ